MEACQIVGELLEENGDTEQALTWFTMAVTRLTEEEIADLRAGDGSSDAFWLLDARRRVRETQGLPPDELDLSIPPEAPTPPEERGGFPFAPHSTEGLAEAIDSGEQQSPAELRPLFWQREEFHEALERSPELAETIGTDHAAYARRLEARWLGLSTRGVSRVLAVPLDFHLLEQVAERLGGDVHDEDVRGTYVTLMVDVRGDYIAWPPGRNEPCWCGSGTKYKKCCGSPTNR